MAKQVKQETRLVDDSGVEWIHAALTPATVKRMIREYQKLEIYLMEVAA